VVNAIPGEKVDAEWTVEGLNVAILLDLQRELEHHVARHQN
jgi:hypothetical protein